MAELDGVDAGGRSAAMVSANERLARGSIALILLRSTCANGLVGVRRSRPHHADLVIGERAVRARQFGLGHVAVRAVFLGHRADLLAHAMARLALRVVARRSA